MNAAPNANTEGDTTVKTNGNEYFYFVSGITVPRYEVDNSLTERLEYFVSNSATKTHKLERLLENRDIDKFITELEEFDRQLCEIHAYPLETEAARMRRLVNVNAGALCRELLPRFIDNVNMLETEIRMMQNKKFAESSLQTNPMERCKHILTVLESFLTLASNSEFEEIFDIAITISELHEGELGTRLMASLVSKNEDGLRKLIGEFTEVFTKKLTERSEDTVVVLKKVLLVDDQPEVLLALSQMLKDQYQVFALSNGKQVLRFLDEHQMDAFILDIDMPEMDGFMLSKRIRQQHGNADKPIMFLTSSNTKETVVKALLSGGKEFASKPINRDVILKKLDRIINS